MEMYGLHVWSQGSSCSCVSPAWSRSWWSQLVIITWNFLLDIISLVYNISDRYLDVISFQFLFKLWLNYSVSGLYDTIHISEIGVFHLDLTTLVLFALYFCVYWNSASKRGVWFISWVYVRQRTLIWYVMKSISPLFSLRFRSAKQCWIHLFWSLSLCCGPWLMLSY